MQFYQVVNDMF